MMSNIGVRNFKITADRAVPTRSVGSKDKLEEAKTDFPEVVARTIKRRRMQVFPDGEATPEPNTFEKRLQIKTRRRNEKAEVYEFLKENKNLLAHWDDILAQCLTDKNSEVPLVCLRSVEDFVDGFEFYVGPILKGP